MSSRRRGAASLTGILLALACNDNPFEPLYQACADEMAKVRSDYVNTSGHAFGRQAGCRLGHCDPARTSHYAERCGVHLERRLVGILHCVLAS